MFNIDTRDFNDIRVVQDFIFNHEGESGTGVNEDNEEILVQVDSTSVAITTFQFNGWTRVNVYYEDGTSEEYYDGKWS